MPEASKKQEWGVSIAQLARHPISLKELARRVRNEIEVDDVFDLAAQTSYYLVLSFFPFLILLAALVGCLPFTGLWDKILSWITLNLPQESQPLIFQTVSNLTPGRGGFLSIGLVGTAWAACTGLMNLMGSLNRAYEVKETRSFVGRLCLAFLILVVLAFLFLASFALLSAGDWLDAWLANRVAHSLLLIRLWQVGRWVASLAMLAVAIAILDYALPNLKRPWRCFTPGTLFTVSAWLPATLGFNVYVRYVASYSRTYGALGAFVVLMVWTYVTTLIVLVGAEINCELHKMRVEAKSEPVPKGQVVGEHEGVHTQGVETPVAGSG